MCQAVAARHGDDGGKLGEGADAFLDHWFE